MPKASDVLADELRARILSDALEPGAPLPSETELIERHQLSRATVREALRLLEADGLIAIKRGPGGGIRVRRPDIGQVSRSLALLFTTTRTTLADFVAFRKLVEPEAAAEAARSATSEQRRWLLEVAGDAPEGAPTLEGAPEFHGAIGACSNNGAYRVILAALDQVLQWHVFAERFTHTDMAGTRQAHRAIAEAVHDRDDRRAARVMARHLESFETAMREQGRLDQPLIPGANWRTRAS